MRQPTRAQVMRLARVAAEHMPPEAREKLINAVSGQLVVVWGSDHFGGYSCPLKAAGFERDYTLTSSHWDVSGGAGFERYWDNEMVRITGLSRGAVGVLP